MTLKEIRKSKKLTQIQASEIVGVPLRTYKRYESERVSQKSEKYKRLIKEISKYNQCIISLRKKETFNIAVFGIGYVGLSIGVLLAKRHNVVMVDLLDEKIAKVNNLECPFKDEGITKYLQSKKLKICAKKTINDDIENVDFAIIATPTNFNYETNRFDTDSVDAVYRLIRSINKKTIIVIKSTVPIGFTEQFKDKNLLFSPEFLREGQALEDNLRPSRIIVGHDSNIIAAKRFASLLQEQTLNQPPVLIMSSKEAESVKLFSNSYLAMRVAYFNELDTFAESNGLDSKKVIEGISLDSRVGDYYNNPSFGYGGYCLPKDTEQLKSSFLDIPNSNLIHAIVESNQTRKQYIANNVIEIAKKLSKKSQKEITIGVYRLIMKTGSDNYRFSAILDVINLLEKKGIHVVVYEKNKPQIGFEIIESLNKFKSVSDLILANRYCDELDDVNTKVYTRDLFTRD